VKFRVKTHAERHEDNFKAAFSFFNRDFLK